MEDPGQGGLAGAGHAAEERRPAREARRAGVDEEPAFADEPMMKEQLVEGEGEGIARSLALRTLREESVPRRLSASISTAL